MSMYLDFEPHSWYKGFAIKRDSQRTKYGSINIWSAYTDDGDTYQIIKLEGFSTLAGLKQEITEYHKQYAEKMVRRYA